MPEVLDLRKDSFRSGLINRRDDWPVPKTASALKPNYDVRYSQPGWYWGTRPTGLARSVVRWSSVLPRKSPSLVDLGTGEGRDSIYFARKGFRALGVDTSSVGLAKATRRARQLGLSVRFQVGDIRTFRLKDRVDVVFSSGVVNNLPPRARAARFAHFKSATLPGGINAINAVVSKPYLKPAMNPATTPFRAGELLGYYWDWKILDSGQVEFDSRALGSPQAMDVVIARKPD